MNNWKLISRNWKDDSQLFTPGRITHQWGSVAAISDASKSLPSSAASAFPHRSLGVGSGCENSLPWDRAEYGARHQNRSRYERSLGHCSSNWRRRLASTSGRHRWPEGCPATVAQVHWAKPRGWPKGALCARRPAQWYPLYHHLEVARTWAVAGVR